MKLDGNLTAAVPVFALATIGPLVFASGLCALVYQVVWLRELRLVFGVSTAASSAVLAIFMGGLGLGGALLGRQADRHPCPVRFYARLELMVAASSAATPFLLELTRHIYLHLGGSMAMGIGLATLVRLALAALVLGVPTVLMGGTLPAAAKGVVAASDAGRRDLAWLYGINTLGAVVGALAATFFMLEIFGMRKTLWLACLVNVLVGMTAQAVARRPPMPVDRRVDEAMALAPAAGGRAVPRVLVFGAAALTGFIFFIMELVWYRTLGPLLGGSTYTFGLILAVALAGIGTGGVLYGVRGARGRVHLDTLALTIGLQAFFLILPYAVGDRLAVLAGLLTPLASLGMAGKILGWTMVAGVVIFPAAVVSGFQFPLLIGLLGRGGRNLGNDTGTAYAWNTGGAIAGALAGGFGFLPLFTAPGVWQGSAAGLIWLCLTVVLAVWKLDGRTQRAAVALVPAIVAGLLLLADGPTAAWRHSSIGAGRTSLVDMDRNQIRDWLHAQRRTILWESEGVEASVGLDSSNGLAFVVNGKVDGNAVGDAPTQVMLGLVSAALHPAARNALVVGLGTGSSAGWLGRVPDMQRVDVVELEPAILTVAEACGPVNQQVMENPKVSVFIADGREFLLTTQDRYDLIVSEPSNPFRAGIASLYTREFYEAVRRRMAPGGVFTQWVQAYDVDAQTIGTIYATLAEVFAFVETWQTQAQDLILICSNAKSGVAEADLRRRLAAEPFRSALLVAWGAVDLEGFAARFIAAPGFARQVAQRARRRGLLNTDDMMLVEFGFARTLGRPHLFEVEELVAAAGRHGLAQPDWTGSAPDRDRVARNRLIMQALNGQDPLRHRLPPDMPDALKEMAAALRWFLRNDPKRCLAAWRSSGLTPDYPLEVAMVAEALADQADPEAAGHIERLGAVWPTTAAAIRARLFFRKGDLPSARAALQEAFTRLRTDPWANRTIIRRAMGLATELAKRQPPMAKGLYVLFDAPFAVRVLDDYRQQTLLDIGAGIGLASGAEAVGRFEPHVPWAEAFLRYRAQSYAAAGSPLARQADKDLQRFLNDRTSSFSETFGL